MKKRLVTLLMALVMVLTILPTGIMGVETSSAADYEARNFMALDNGWFWGYRLQISWINAANELSKVELYQDGVEEAIYTNDAPVSNETVVFKTPGNETVSEGNMVYSFKLVSTFADGTVTEQYTHGITYERGNYNLHWNSEESGDTEVHRGNGWKFRRYRGGTQNWSGSTGGDEIFPGKLEITYIDGNPVARLYSAAAESGHRAVLFSKFVPTSGKKYTLSFDYKTTNCEKVNVKMTETLLDANTDGWQKFEKTFTSTGTAQLVELYQKNEEVLIDNVVLTEEGSTTNLIIDGDFSGYASLKPSDVTDAEVALLDGVANITWTDSADIVGAKLFDNGGVKVYKKAGTDLLLKGYIAAGVQEISLINAAQGDVYILKSVNKIGVESEGVELSIPVTGGNEDDGENITSSSMHPEYARNFMALDNGWFWGYRLQISWINAANELSKVELYQDGVEEAIYTNDAPVSNETVVFKTPKNETVSENNKVYSFKLVSTFADGTVTEQFTHGITYERGNYNLHWNSEESGDTEVQRGNGWKFRRYRGGTQNYSGSSGGDEIFPGKLEITYIDGNPVAKMYSAAAESGHRAVLFSKFVPTSGKKYTLSFDYKTTNCEKVNIKMTETVLDANTDGWQKFEKTFTSTGTAQLVELYQKNEEVLIDNVVLTEEGSTTNLIIDGDFSGYASMKPSDVTGASMTVNSGVATLAWTDSADIVGAKLFDNGGVNVYKVIDDEAVLVAYIAAGKGAAMIGGASDDDAYILKAVTKIGVESDSVRVEKADESMIDSNKNAASDLAVMGTGNTGEIVVSWKNAGVANISKITLLDGDGNILSDAFDTTAGAARNYLVKGIEDGIYYDFTLITETSDGKKYSQPISGINSIVEGYNRVVSLGGINITHNHSGSNFSQSFVEVVNDGANGTAKGLKVVNNRSADLTTTYMNIAPKVTLEPNTEYEFSVMAKGCIDKLYARIYKYANAWPWNWALGSGTVNDWTEYSVKFTTEEAEASPNIFFCLESVTNGNVWLDEFKLVKTSAPSVNLIEDGSFDNISDNVNVVTGINATAKDSSTVIKWTAPSFAKADMVRAYVETDGVLKEAGVFSPNASGYEFTNLINNKKYTFYFETVKNNIVSESVTVEVTPVPDKYKVSDVQLLDENGNDVSLEAIKAGNYTVSAKIKNNGMGDYFTAEVVVCLYDGNTLYSAKSSNVKTIEESEYTEPATIVTTETITVPYLSGHNFSIKAYVWNSLKGMQPLTDVIEF